MPAVRTELELITAAQAGDVAALGQLLLMHRERLMHHLSVRMPASARRVTSVDDILQHAYTAAFRSFDAFSCRGEGSFFAWLRSIAEHQMFNTIRDLQRQKRGGNVRTVSVGEAKTADSMFDLFNMLSSAGDSPSMRLQRAEAVDAMLVALAELPADHHEVIRRRFLLGQTLDETADGMQRTPAAIRSLTDRAKKRLRELMGSLSMYLSTR